MFSRCARKSARKSRVRPFVLLTALFATECLFVGWTAQQADRAMREDLLLLARLAKQSVDLHALSALTGSSADIGKPEYTLLKKQLATLRHANSKCRFLYFLGRKAEAAGPGRRQGPVFFYMDSEHERSKDYSPPGQVYEDLSEEDARVFDTKTANVTGPTPDRWGTWVSALLPITDPASGALIAVLGMDVDAQTWRWDVAARTALPASLMLAILIFLSAGMVATRQRNTGSAALRPIQRRLLMPLAIALLLMAAGSGMLLLKQQRDSLNRLSRTALQGVVSDLSASVAEQTRTLDALGKMVLKSEGLLAALKARDRNSLLAQCQPLFATLKAEYALSLFYLIAPDQACLLRLHKPDLSGDRIDRFTLREAARLGKPSAGLELGPLGFFTLRSVFPIHDNGSLLGYLELGKEIEDVVENLHAKNEIDFAITIRKTLLDRPRWEEGLGLRGRKADWNRFTESALVYSTLPVLPASIGGLIEGARPEGGKTFMEAHAGGQTWHVMTAPLKDASAAEVGSLVVLFDITEGKAAQNRVRAVGLAGGVVLLAGLFGFLYVLLRRTDASIRLQQSSLQKSEQRLSATLRSIGDGVITTDASGRVTDLNTVAERLTGWTTEQAAGHPLAEVFRIVHAMTRTAEENPVEKALRQGVVVELGNHTLLIAKNGAEHQIADSCAPIRNARDEIMGTVLVFRDVSKEYQQRADLQASESRLRAITGAAQDAILMMDAEGRVSFWNPAADRIFGYTRDEVLGRDLHLLLAPQRYLDSFRTAFAVFRKNGQGGAVNKTIELTALHKTGREIPIELSLSNLYLDSCWHAVGIIRDITERKRTEDEIRGTNRQLAEAIARANEMTAQAQQASVAKSDFLANMSHEIRTPMNGVIGMTGLLLDTELTDEQRRYAETVRASAESLLGLINDILDFSKIEAGKMLLEALDFDLQELVEDLAATLALRAHGKGLELLYSVATEVPTLLRGDPGRLRQILTNLVSNAIKFTPSGEVAIRVLLESEDAASAVLRFSVRDTGIGIPKDKIGTLFEKFTQADTSTTRKYGGTGLGLAICKQLTELMGGEIGIASEAGKGSEFSVTLRLAKQREGVKDKTPAPVDLRTVRVLIVDDNATSREILTAHMLAWGMRPAETADGPSAIQLLLQAVAAGDPFQIAVLDMQMPVMDGEMLGQAIKGDARLAATPLIMLTSLGTRDCASHFQEIGFAACLTKPARHQELKRALSQALADRHRSVPPAQTPSKRHAPLDLTTLFSGNKSRILLAEDNITNQQVALGILKKIGLRADAVADGAEALKALEAIPYDLVLMDVQMPVMDGLEATRQIRNPQSPVRDHAVAVIAMTARAMQGDQEKCLAAGMNDYVSKPVTPQTLARVLEKWLKPQAKSPKTAPSELPRHTETQVPSPPDWDRAGMMERVMEDLELAKAVLEGFPEDISHRIQTLKALLETGDIAGAERQAHSINGASSIVGGEALRAEALEIENAARAGDQAAAAMRIPELVRRFDRLKVAIETQLTAWRN